MECSTPTEYQIKTREHTGPTIQERYNRPRPNSSYATANAKSGQGVNENWMKSLRNKNPRNVHGEPRAEEFEYKPQPHVFRRIWNMAPTEVSGEGGDEATRRST